MKTTNPPNKQDLLQRQQALMRASKPPHPHFAAKLLGITEDEYYKLTEVFVAQTAKK